MNGVTINIALAPILSLARAGATSRSWDAFVEAGLDGVTSDPKVMTLKGRLLKDQARKASGEAQARLFLRSAKAYADAAALKPDSYPLINAATMSLFAGQADHMRALAGEVLALMQTGVGQGETPYWHSATRAEAMLLLGDVDAAKAALTEAISHAPLAWEDHATTLRQFRQILALRRDDEAWFAGLAPPLSLYFGGMMGLAADDDTAKNAVERAISDMSPGFGYGALAAGADILIAEALVGRGAELHIVLPVIPSLFKAISVDPFGADWSVRFDALFEIAATVEIIDGGPELSLAAVDIASQVAKGRAVDNAARLESSATGLTIIATGHSPAAAQGLQTVTLAPSAPVEKHAALPTGEQSVLMATSSATLDAPNDPVVAAYADIAEAGRALNKWRTDQPDASIAVSFGVVHGSSEAREAQIRRMLRSAATGTTIASAEAAMSLKARDPAILVEPLGELPDVSGAISLFSITVR